MYETRSLLSRTLNVHHPAAESARIVVRTELDWETDVEAATVSEDRRVFTFQLQATRPFLYVKVCLVQGDEVRWATGANLLVLLTATGARDVYPTFGGSESGTITPVLTVSSAILGRDHVFRVYLPAGYEENPLRRYPVLYMHDGKNLFFPEEAFLEREWRVDESLALLDSMNAVDKCLVVGLHPHDRMCEYTQPGYEAFARAIVQEVKPWIDRELRTLSEREETGVMGSSLGGVVSFYMGWQYPEVFGFAACMSSTFSHQDDLVERVLSEPRRDTRFYLDSGWPGDNYEVTLAMAMALTERGYVPGRDVVHFAFPHAEHHEHAWGDRLHLPLQVFGGKISTAARGRYV
jgi:predicted alpha/beta superfamily hydrolase